MRIYCKETGRVILKDLKLFEVSVVTNPPDKNCVFVKEDDNLQDQLNMLKWHFIASLISFLITASCMLLIVSLCSRGWGAVLLTIITIPYFLIKDDNNKGREG